MKRVALSTEESKRQRTDLQEAVSSLKPKDPLPKAVQSSPKAPLKVEPKAKVAVQGSPKAEVKVLTKPKVATKVVPKVPKPQELPSSSAPSSTPSATSTLPKQAEVETKHDSVDSGDHHDFIEKQIQEASAVIHEIKARIENAPEQGKLTEAIERLSVDMKEASKMSLNLYHQLEVLARFTEKNIGMTERTNLLLERQLILLEKGNMLMEKDKEESESDESSIDEKDIFELFNKK